MQAVSSLRQFLIKPQYAYSFFLLQHILGHYPYFSQILYLIVGAILSNLRGSGF
jgi:hypothetical protein